VTALDIDGDSPGAGRSGWIGRGWKWFLGSRGEPLSPWRTIQWWEVRRPVYNVLLAPFGSVAVLVFFWAITRSGELKLGEDAEEPLALLAAPVLANVAYTLGWVTELIVNVARGSDARRIGPVLLRVGLTFSGVVIFAPPVVWSVILVAHTMKR
jgi:hypothetical protein